MQNLSRIDGQIRAGKISEARETLQRIECKKLPREDLVVYSALARRLDLALLGIRCLAPHVRPSTRRPGRPNDAELAEYAGCLVRIGAPDEAIQLLATADKTKAPSAFLFEAFARIATWDYEGAIPLLEEYATKRATSEYDRLVAEANLLAGLVHERDHKAANKLLESLLGRLVAPDRALLRANVQGLGVANAVLGGNWEIASDLLDSAKQGLGQTESLDELFLRKWEAVAAILREPQDANAAKSLNAVRCEARDRGHWETVRDCDRFEAIARQDESLYLKLYFGTPFEPFRKWLTKGFRRPVALPDSYVWSPPGGDRAGTIVNLTPTASPEEASIPHGRIPHKTLCALASDFYRPLRLATLHARLFPGEFFNPDSSPVRVHQALTRLRRWIGAQEIPLGIEEADGTYLLRSTNRCRVRVQGPQLGPISKTSALLESLRQRWPKGTFSADEATKALGVSRRTVVRLLAEAVKSETLAMHGRGRTTVYGWVQESVSATYRRNERTRTS